MKRYSFWTEIAKTVARSARLLDVAFGIPQAGRYGAGVGRPRKFVEEDVVSAAAALFAAQGYGATTLEDLMAATGLGRQSLYNSFGGKRELFLRALSDNTGEALRAIDDAFVPSDASPLERIRAHVLKQAVVFSGSSYEASLFLKATLELGPRDPDVALTSRVTLDRLEGVYRRSIIDAQEAGEIDSAADPAALAGFFVAMTQGMQVLGVAGFDRAALTATALTALQALPAPRP